MIVLYCKARLALAIDVNARCRSQLEMRSANEAEFVICDQAIDITYIRLRYGWLYLVAIVDWYSRYVVSWALSETLELPFVLEAVDAALTTARPQIWNSDQGSHFTSPQYTQRLEAIGIQISMDGKGRALDTIFTERFWRTIKYEEIYLADYAHPKAARQGISHYMTFYNEERPHQALAYQTPAAIYHGTMLLTEPACS